MTCVPPVAHTSSATSFGFSPAGGVPSTISLGLHRKNVTEPVGTGAPVPVPVMTAWSVTVVPAVTLAGINSATAAS